MAKNDKTNVMRVLEQHKIPYEGHNYLDSGAVGGTEVAAALNEDPEVVFKTLVTVGKTGNHYVFLVPVEKELNLKKAAAAVGEKNIEMIKSKELLPLTGYIHGGCSPIGMKKQFQTVIHESAEAYPEIYVSGGRIGTSIKVEPQALAKVARAKFDDIIRKAE